MPVRCYQAYTHPVKGVKNRYASEARKKGPQEIPKSVFEASVSFAATRARNPVVARRHRTDSDRVSRQDIASNARTAFDHHEPRSNDVGHGS